MNRIQERALRIVYKDYVSAYAQLLEKDSSVLIHVRNLQVLATEIFKARNNLSPTIVQISLKQMNQFTAYVEILFQKPQNANPTIWY